MRSKSMKYESQNPLNEVGHEAGASQKPRPFDLGRRKFGSKTESFGEQSSVVRKVPPATWYLHSPLQITDRSMTEETPNTSAKVAPRDGLYKDACQIPQTETLTAKRTRLNNIGDDWSAA